MKKVLVLLGSPRRNGNTGVLADALISGVQASGAQVEVIECGKLENKVRGCAGCFGCQPDHFRCVLQDETAKLVNRLMEFDTVVFATPIYFFGMTSQLKMFVDRLMCQVGHLSDGTFLCPIKKIQFAMVVTSGGDAQDSGLDVLKLQMKNFEMLLGTTPIPMVYRGLCGADATPTRNDQAILAQAKALGESLGK